jgi:hypothetical protein
MKLQEIVPWGRSFDEYRAMFALDDADLAGTILGCGDGPASFNAGAGAHGARVVSVDPLYAFSAAEIRARIDAVRGDIEAGLRANQARYVWTRFATVEDLLAARLAAMERFLVDYAGAASRGADDPGKGGPAGYVAAALPRLPFADGQFDLALVSHLLFTYSAHLSADDHRRAVAELLRVAREVRAFPLLDLAGEPSPHVDAVCDAAAAAAGRHAVVTVDYEFQRGGDRMLRLLAPR